MRLTKLYIAGFGNLQDFTYEFSDGINVVNAPNGWGKSTFAAFLRAMFYGLGDSRARSVAENVRKRYTPWGGGSFGGSLELEANGKGYRIERFFGAKESEDTFTLFSLETGKESEDFTENIGEELFGIDADGFSRTAFMDASAHIHGKVEKNANNSINTKLNNLLQAENDLGNFEQAMDALVRRKRQYKTTGERGEIYAGERRLLELQRQIETCLAQKAQAQELDLQIAQLQPVVVQSEKEMQALQQDMARASGQRERRAILEAYSRMRSEVSAAKKELESISARFKGEIPTQAETEKMQVLAGQLGTLAGRAQQLHGDNAVKDAIAKLLPRMGGKITPLGEIDRALEICDELRGMEGEIRAHAALAASLEDQAEAIGEPALPKQGKHGKKAGAGKVFGVILASLSGAMLITAAVLLLLSKVLLGILCGIGGLALLALAVYVLLSAVSAAQLSGRSKRAADAAFKIETKKRLLEERDRELGLAQEYKERYADKAAVPVALAQKHGLDVESGYISALSALRSMTDQYLRLCEQQKAKDALYEGIVAEADALWDRISTFLSRWSKPFDRENCAFVLAELRTVLADVQRRKQEIEQKEAAARTYATEKNVRALAEQGSHDEVQLPAPEELSAKWEHSRDRHAQQSAALAALVQKAEALYEAADAYGALVAEKQALEDTLAVQNANYVAISYAEKYLALARENLSSRYLDKMQNAFVRRMQQMGGEGMQFSMDTDFGITLREKGKSRSIEYLSSGWRDMVGFCLRLCLADGLFDAEKPCLVLDDPFVYLDTAHTAAARRLLDELAEDYQILYLTCKE
ncbi:MAG: AAA family ATPase [Clostridia bacterium]|nr:AAA family ATPase [Clostridia bacterium]MBQ5793153.1 AAA family ATPase [Clostridia bacterium]